MSSVTSAGRHAEGRVHPDVRRQAAEVGGQRSALRRLGDLPPQGVAGRSEPHLRLADQRLVRADDAAVERRRRDLGRRWTTSSSTTARPARTSGTTARRTRGSSSACGTSSRRSPIPTRSTPASKTRRCSAPTDGGKTLARAAGPAQPRHGLEVAAGRGRLGLHTILLDPTNPHRMFIAISAAGAFRTDDGGSTWTADQPRAEVAVHSRSRRRGRPLRPPHRHAPVAAEHAVHAEALGRDAHRRRGRRTGPRSAATCRPTSASRSTSTRTSRRRSTSCRSRATREHFPPEGKLRVYRSRTGGNEWEPLTKGLPQQDCYVNVLRDAMAVDSLDACGVYFGTTGGQVYARPTAATRGRRSCAICRPCCRSRCRRCHDPRRAAAASADAGAGRPRSRGRRSRDRSTPASSSTRSRRATRCCGARSATTSRRSGGRSSASSPARRTCRTSAPTCRCPRRWCGAPSRS